MVGALIDGTADAIIASLSITPERFAVIDQLNVIVNDE